MKSRGSQKSKCFPHPSQSFANTCIIEGSKAKGKGASYEEDNNNGELKQLQRGNTVYRYWDDESDLSDDGVRDEDDFEEDVINIKRTGKTFQMFNKHVTDKVPEKLSKEAAKAYKSRGPYRYRPSELVDALTDGQELTPSVIVKDEEGAHYVGEVNNASEKHGRGITIYQDGSVYEGFFRNNERHGAGRIIYENGDIYQGEWENGKCHGYGLYDSKNVSDFKGWWEDGMIHGKGFEKLNEEYTYRGNFKRGKKFGEGIMHFLKEGNRYEGKFKNDQLNGTGTYTYKDGRTYVGTFRNSIIHGKGKYTWPDGSSYVGDYNDGEKHGKGTFIWKEGNKYEGEFKNNKQHGEGIYTNTNGVARKGIWENGNHTKWLD